MPPYEQADGEVTAEKIDASKIWSSVAYTILFSQAKRSVALLLTWVNFNPNMDIIIGYTDYKVWDEITYLFPNFNSATVEV